jgi:hypothetical protein
LIYQKINLRSFIYFKNVFEIHRISAHAMSQIVMVKILWIVVTDIIFVIMDGSIDIIDLDININIE